MSAPLRLRQLASLLAALLMPAALLAGQTVSAHAVIAAPMSSVRVGSVMERMDGVWAGLALDFHAGRLTLSGSGTRGHLKPAQVGAVPKRDVGELSLGGQYQFRTWLSFDLRYDARAFSSAAGYQRWNMMRVGATASRNLGIPAVRAFAGLSYLHVITVSGQQRPTIALGSDIGITLLPRHSPIALQLDYRVERFDFPASVARSEQFEAFTISMGVRMQRVDGRWKVGSPEK